MQERRVKYLKYWRGKKKPIHLEIYIQQKNPSKVNKKKNTLSDKQKLREFVSSKSACEKYFFWKKSFSREKENDIGQKMRSLQRKEEYRRKNTWR